MRDALTHGERGMKDGGMNGWTDGRTDKGTEERDARKQEGLHSFLFAACRFSAMIKKRAGPESFRARRVSCVERQSDVYRRVYSLSPSSIRLSPLLCLVLFPRFSYLVIPVSRRIIVSASRFTAIPLRIIEIDAVTCIRHGALLPKVKLSENPRQLRPRRFVHFSVARTEKLIIIIIIIFAQRIYFRLGYLKFTIAS